MGLICTQITRLSLLAVYIQLQDVHVNCDNSKSLELLKDFQKNSLNYYFISYII